MTTTLDKKWRPYICFFQSREQVVFRRYYSFGRIRVYQHECGQMNSTMTLLKPINDPNLILPYEQYYIQSLHREDKLILEQSPGETNPLFQMAINPQPPHSTRTDQ